MAAPLGVEYCRRRCIWYTSDLRWVKLLLIIYRESTDSITRQILRIVKNPLCHVRRESLDPKGEDGERVLPLGRPGRKFQRYYFTSAAPFHMYCALPSWFFHLLIVTLMLICCGLRTVYSTHFTSAPYDPYRRGGLLRLSANLIPERRGAWLRLSANALVLLLTRERKWTRSRVNLRC